MTNQIIADKIQSIKDSINCQDYIGRDIDLKGRGKWLTGFCPFHDNHNTPSFSVAIDGWKCYGACSESGDIFSYVMKREKCDFTRAYEILANGLPLTADKPVKPQISPKIAPKSANRTFTPINPKIGNLGQWQRYAPSLSADLVDGYGLTSGVMPSNTCHHARLLVPMSIGGVVYGFRGRALDCHCAKWSQSAGSRAILYNGAILLSGLKGGAYDHQLTAVQNRLSLGDSMFMGHGAIETVFIVENPIDCILLQQAKAGRGIGFVAIMGINPNQSVFDDLRLACQLAKVKRVVIAFDRAKANNQAETAKAVARAKGLLSGHGFEVVQFAWPGGGAYKDFGEYFKQADKPAMMIDDLDLKLSQLKHCPQSPPFVMSATAGRVIHEKDGSITIFEGDIVPREYPADKGQNIALTQADLSPLKISEGVLLPSF